MSIVTIYAGTEDELVIETKLGPISIRQNGKPCFVVTVYDVLDGHELVGVYRDINDAQLAAEATAEDLGTHVEDLTVESAPDAPPG